MSLNKSALARDLEDVLTGKPSLDETALSWANAYVSYAQNAMSAASSLPVNAAGGLGILQSAFAGAFRSQSASGAAAAIGAGVTSFWATILWVGATASGATIVPGNFSLSGSLTAVFTDTAQKSESEKAGALADALDAGAKQVIALEVPYAQPAPPISGPIG
jgi:hypothetical protein